MLGASLPSVNVLPSRTGAAPGAFPPLPRPARPYEGSYTQGAASPLKASPHRGRGGLRPPSNHHPVRETVLHRLFRSEDSIAFRVAMDFFLRSSGMERQELVQAVP